MYDLTISNARLADAPGLWDICAGNGQVLAVEPAGRIHAARETLRADGRLLLPGLIDSHVHTRDPGYVYKEDFISVTKAAANAGVTTIMAMPNTNPPMTTAAAVKNARERLEGRHLVDVRLVGGVCAAVAGWILPAAQAGVIALDVYDDPFARGTQDWINLFSQAKRTGLPLCFYLMDAALERLRTRQSEGAAEWERIAGATNGETEAISIARIFPMAAYFQVPVVLRMASTAAALEMVRTMRKQYPCAQVFVEVCVHYLFLTRDALAAQGGRAHIHPPLRAQQDVDALWRGIEDGTVDVVASDHAPHADFEKDREPLSANACGMAGLETMLPLLLDAYNKGRLGLCDIQRLCCEKPARIYGLFPQKGTLHPGSDADFVLVDTEQAWTVRSAQCYTKGAPGPFEGRRLKGGPVITFCAGRKVMDNRTVFWNVEEKSI